MDLTAIEARARNAIGPLAAAEASTAFGGARTEAGRSLPPYYLVYFLLVKLADTDEAGHAFQNEAGHLFQSEAGRRSDLMSATGVAAPQIS